MADQSYDPPRTDAALYDAADAIPPAPDRWVRLEIFGHRQHHGRLTKVEEFGASFARVEERCTRDHLIRPPVQYPGSAIFSLAEIPEADARRMAAQYDACPHADCEAARQEKRQQEHEEHEEQGDADDLFDPDDYAQRDEP